jgi:hypothetical protein
MSANVHLRTNLKLKVKRYQNHKMISKRIIRFRYHQPRKAFLTETARNYLKRINFKDGITAEITVYYCSTEFTNRGVYDNQQDLLLAFDCFTEQSLLTEEWDKVLLPPRTLSQRARMALKRTGFKKKIKVPAKKKS